jgi:Zn-dependent M16 (insulinase) family peptidase
MVVKYGFELEREKKIPELNMKASIFRHVQTQAQLLSLESQDENKVFGITFRTPPADSTGIAHIMEHSVLCGSEKYPLKEPFVELLKGSLKTFLNAFTYPDKTCYPLASQNVKDFYNLIDVYVDAVFHPLIPPAILQQEGWHFELDDPKSPMIYKGVVFNEMKGSYSNPDDVFQDAARFSLFPDTPYSVDSGGDPREIPNLSYEQFKRFHDRYYHPSNARIFFYGDDDPDERLERMDGYLSKFKYLPVDSSIPLQPAFSQPRRSEVPYDPGDEAEAMKGRLVMSWLLSETEDPETMLGLHILAHILIGTPASPLRKALIDSGLGDDMAGVGLESELRQAYFSTGLRGIGAEPDGRLPAAPQIEHLIMSTLESLASEGIDPDMLAASLNTVEFRLRENNTGAFPRGLLLMLRALTTWLYDGDPIAPLAFEAPLTAIKDRLAMGEAYFESLIQRFFLANSHRTSLILKPEPGYQKQRDDEERKKLAKLQAEMSLAELEQIVQQTQYLKEMQKRPDAPEALARIPSLKLTDLDKEVKLIPMQELQISGAQVLYHYLFTNGIVYFDLGFDLHTLPQELLPYVSIFGRALLEMGTAREDYVRLSQHIGRSTGGIWPASYTSLIRGTNQGAARLFIRSKATVSQIEELFAILKDILLTARLDNRERFRQITLEAKANAEAMLVPAGHQVVNNRLRALFNEADWSNEQMNGISQLFFLRDLVVQIDQNWAAVHSRLESLRRILLDRKTMIFNLTLDSENWINAQPRLAEFLDGLPAIAPAFATWEPVHGSTSEGLTIPAQVNYVGKGANLFDLGYSADGSISVITNYLRTTWLWERVRVQGGAYGGFCQFNQRSGVFTYLSYRDPNLTETLAIFDQTASFLRQLELDPAELTKAIIGAIGETDAYQLPDAKGFTSLQRFLTGESDTIRQKWRDQILNTTLKDFHDLGEVLAQLSASGYVVVMGAQEAMAKANTEQGDWLEVKKVL